MLPFYRFFSIRIGKTDFYKFLPILTYFYRFLPIFTDFYRFYRFLHIFTDFYRLLPNPLGLVKLVTSYCISLYSLKNSILQKLRCKTDINDTININKANLCLYEWVDKCKNYLVFTFFCLHAVSPHSEYHGLLRFNPGEAYLE